MLPPTEARVPRHTPPEWNKALTRESEARLAHFAGRPAAIDDRLHELDREWDMERALEANAAMVILSGLALSALHDRRWAFASGAAAGFLLQHALQGWCPPVRLFRRLGFRTAAEIQAEKAAVLALRDDWKVGPRRVLRHMEMH